MKEYLNNTKELNKNTRLNLPTTWTKKKMASLFLMGLLSVNGVEAGRAFSNCLAFNDSDIDSYNSLLNFNFDSQPNIAVNNEMIELCCQNGTCSSCLSGSRVFTCVKVNSLIFCTRRAGWCHGIIGNSPITTNVSFGAYCAEIKADLATVANFLTTPSANIAGTEQGYAVADCFNSSSPCLSFTGCSWDNGGWSCPSFGFNSFADNCLLQWPAPWPGPADRNPFPTTLTSTSTISLNTKTSSFSSSTSAITSNSVISSISPNEPHLAEKIAIPAGTIVGVATIGGVSYLIYKKRKKRVLLVAGNREQGAESSRNEPTDNEVIASVSQNKELPGLPVQDFNFQIKNNELEQLIQQTKDKVGSNLEIALETLLDTQSEIAKGNDNYTLRQNLREAKKELQVKLSLEEINNLCQLQSEIIQLQQEQELQAQIEVNPYGQEVRNLGRE